MSNHKQHIPTLEEIQKYVSGRADFPLQYKVEKAMESDPAIKEMVEGFQKNITTALSEEELVQKKDMDQLKRNFMQKASIKPGFKSYNIFILSISILVITVLTLMYFNKVDFNSAEKIHAQKTESETTSSDDIDNNETLPLVIEEEIKAEKISAEQSERQEEKSEKSKEFEEEESKPMSVVQMAEMEPLQPLKPNPLKIPENKKPAKISCKVAYYHELKMMSYRDIYSNEDDRLELSGTPATLANKNDENKIEKHTENVPYEEYMSDGLKLFKNERYQDFLEYIEPILVKYPKDQNALFYGGLSHLNLGNLEKAEQFLKPVAFSQYDAFHEEGHWYYALSMYQSGKTEQAKNLMQKIINEDGFYASRAKKFMAEK